MLWTLVTGGAMGLGAEICRALAKQGRNIAIHYRQSKSAAASLAEELIGYRVKSQIVQGNFSSLQSTEQFLKTYLAQFPHTEAIVNNVGNYWIGPASRTSPGALLELLQLNAVAPLAIVQALLPTLKSHQGRIVNIGMAGADKVVANTHATAYNLSKLNLAMLTKSLAKELAVHGITVNMVSPGYLEQSLEMPRDASAIPAGRLGQLEEVARAVVFFLDPANGYITGQNLKVAGGIRLGA
jgi:NAD(P)-dependent dehydrogenase (short-subunit alcohol dehydrogenase family)